MAKKKQKKPDFQKTKLKVGRKITKGRNITDTSFKSKRIIAPAQNFASASEKSLPEILFGLKTNNASLKLENLQKIDKYIHTNKENIFLDFSNILPKVGMVVMDSDPIISSKAAGTLSSCIKLLSELQYNSYSNAMLIHLNCMMSHGAPFVKEASLVVLESLLTTHPKVVTKQYGILVNLLNMISTKKHGVRSLDDLVSSKMTSVVWYQKVLHIVQLHLRLLVEQEDQKNNEDSPGSNEIKVDFSWYSPPEKTDKTKIGLKQFIIELVQVLSDIVKGVSTPIQEGDGTMLKQNDVKQLNQIVQLLCYIGELTKIHITCEDNDTIVEEIQRLVLYFLKGFPFSESVKGVRKDNAEPETPQLNLGLCFLYTLFILDNSANKDVENQFLKIVPFLETGFSISVYKSARSLSLILKLSRNFMLCPYVETPSKNKIFNRLLQMQQSRRSADFSNSIHAFFIEMALDRRYSESLNSIEMSTWFKSLFQELCIMTETKEFNLQILNCIKQLCARKCKPYLQVLEEDFSENMDKFLALLEYNHEDFQTTIMCMITIVGKMPPHFFPSLHKLISNQIFTSQMAAKIVRLLNLRYKKPEVLIKDKIIFVKFLLNTAVDMQSFKQFSYGEHLDIENSSDDNKLFHTIERVFQDYKHVIVPSRKGNSYYKAIIEACVDSLMCYIDNVNVKVAINLFLENFLGSANDPHKVYMPVHTLYAFLQIERKICGTLVKARDVMVLTHFLYYSSFLYLSVMRDAACPIVDFLVPELEEFLLNYLDISPITCMILYEDQHIDHDQTRMEDLSVYHHIMHHRLRILVFLAKNSLLVTDHLSSVLRKFIEIVRCVPNLSYNWEYLLHLCDLTQT